MALLRSTLRNASETGRYLLEVLGKLGASVRC